MELPKKQNRTLSLLLIVVIVAASLAVGGLIGYWTGSTAASDKIDKLQKQLSTIQEQIDNLQAKSEAATKNQSSILQTIDALQSQLSAIQSQISSLQATSVTSQKIDEIMEEVETLRSQLLALQAQIKSIDTTTNIVYVLGENVSLSQLFEQVRDSVVVVKGLRRTIFWYGSVYSQVQGSGFVYNYSGQPVILTNNHVIENAVNITVTFTNGKVYSASVKGSNPNTDVAVLLTSAPQNEMKPLLMVSSSTLRVGDPVVVVGTPYGLEGSMSNGIISALNRTITTESTTLTNIIQTTAPLNPGNSGGPLLNYQGQVVGMATAIVEDSQGIGFAIPSDTILQDVRKIMV
ncbi:MAG: trypsin-like peptidase domain-containing protein [Candidatus Bathyarchaeota archaeon]|nr:trypsin-like peptidase domain-containing protein [Candidatus Bathyarchaeota archaeon]